MTDELRRIAAQIALMPTPEQWAELRSRVETLERDAAMAELRVASAEARPAGLVERIEAVAGGDARAALREVAAAAKETGYTSAEGLINWLEAEAGIRAEMRAAIRSIDADNNG